MFKILDKLGSPNFWVTVASVLAVVGIAIMLLSLFSDNSVLMVLGTWLLAPLALGGLLLAVVVIPMLIWRNKRHRSD
jgi:hypothetical protein